MDVRLLGPVEASVDGRVVAVGAGKPRALLAMLSLHAGSTVSSERLIDGLWGERPPATAAKLVQLHVSQLRKAFDAAGDGGKIVTRGHGYQLRLTPEDLDVGRFERLVARGRPREALALWRGPALDDVAGEPFAAAEVRRLEELRLAAVELAIERDLAAGRHRDVVGELERLVVEEPLREKLHEQRMLALYRSGRQVEALEAYREARTALAEYAGVEPGPELRGLQEAILHQDPSLAVRRLGESASRLAATRPALRAAEAALAGDVYELQAARQRVALPAGRDVACPFKGLATFEVEDAELFFGRERLVADMVARVTGAPLTGIVGPSGSGKSSVLRAGLLAALAAGVLPGSERWGVALLRPGERPVAALERAVAEAGDPGRLVVAVDQFEEVFTACRDERERAAFADALTALVRERRRRAVVLVALRADFYGRCAAYPELSRLLGAGQVLVGAMRRDELRRAIELPARHAGLDVDPGLVDALLADVEGQPGGLPLLSTALVELWQHRDGRRLSAEAYEHAGGVHGAVARLAERAYARLDPERRRAARVILLRLAGETDEGAVVRRRVPLDELQGAGVAEVLAVLADDRLVTIGEGEAEVAHEALLWEWPRLRGWLDEDREGRRVHRRLSVTAQAWSEGGRDRGDLYRGARLASALEWRADHEPELNATEQQFLDAGRAAAERARRRLQLAFAGAVALLLLAAGAAGVALDQRGRAQDHARLAEAQVLGARALSEPRLDRSLLLARQGVALDDAPAGRDSLLAVLRRNPAAIGVMHGDGGVLTALALHPDGRTLAVGDDDGTVSFLDAVTRRRRGKPHQVTFTDGARITSLAFSPDGTRLASAGWEPAGAFVNLFDGRTLGHMRRVAYLPTAAEASVHFSPDSRLLAAQDPDADRVSSSIARWDARTGEGEKLPQSEAVLGGSSAVLGFVGSAAQVVTFSEQDGATAIRDSVTLRSLRRFTTPGSTAALSPSAGLVAYGAWDGSVRLLDLRTGRLRTARGRHEAPVVAMRFSRDGERLVTAGRDERLIVWDPVQATAVETLDASGIGLVQAVELASDHGTAYSAGRDGTVIVWDVTGERRWERPFAAHATPWVSSPVATGASGSRFAVVDARGFVNLFMSESLRPAGRIRPAGQVTGAAVSRDGRTLATTTSGLTEGALEFWDARMRRRLGRPRVELPHAASSLAFSDDGRWLAVAGIGRIVRLWDARRRAEVRSALIDAADLAFSPDGTMLAAPLLDGVDGLRVVAVPSLEVIATVRLPIGTVVHFAADGRSLIYGDRQGRVWTLDTRTWTPRGRPLDAGAPIVTADLSPDGRLLATTSTDGTGRLWDTASRRPIGAAVSSRTADPIGALFIRGGTHLAVMHAREGVAWDVRPDAWARHACAVAGRALSRSEWAGALPRHEYAPACARR